MAFSKGGFAGSADASRRGEAGERTPLLRDGQGQSITNRPDTSAVAIDGATDDGAERRGEIDPNDFDLLLSKSVPTSGGFLEPESTEHLLLRGARRYSSASGPGTGPVLSRSGRCRSRRSSSAVAGSATVEESDLATSPRSSYGDGSSSPAGRAADSSASTPLLADPAQEDAKLTPYLNGISPPRFWVIFSTILATYFIACFDGTIMASSHPVITSYFRSSNSASWLSTAFLLTSTAFQPLLGRISDSLGRKPPYLVTMVIFALSTAWCALAQSMTSFILARAACGIGAGGMMTLGSIIVSDMVPIELRGTYQSYINIIYGIGSALGAALGGAMADHLGWRWEFGVQAIPLLLCVVAAGASIPNDLGLVGKKQTVWEALRVFDFRGSFLLTVSLTFFVLGLNLGGNVLPWSHPLVIASLALFVVAFPAFIYSQSLATRPIMPLRLVRHAPHANLILSNFFGSLLMNAILFNVPLFFQAVLLTSATASGFHLVLPSLVSSAAGAATGLVITRTKRLKWSLTAGTALFFAGSLALSFLRRGWPDVAYLLVLIPHSLGQGFQFPGTLMAVLAASDQADQAVVTATLILWRSLGTILGVASSSLVMQNMLLLFLEENVRGPDKRDVIERVRESVESVARLDSPYQDQVIESYEGALRVTFGCCALLALVSVCIVYPVKLPRLGQRK